MPSSVGPYGLREGEIFMSQVSVIVPTFNRRDCLVDSIRSALNQTCQDIEVIVVDDGSTDESAVEVLRHFGPDPERAETIWRNRTPSKSGTCGFGFWTPKLPLQYIYILPNRGMGAARNRGIAVAHGEIIAFLEPGFVWDANYLERQTEFLHANPDTWIVHGRISTGRPSGKNGRKRCRGAAPIGFEEVVGGTDLHASGIVARRGFLEAHGGFDENLPSCEDYDLWIRIASHMPIMLLPDAVVHAGEVSAPPAWTLDRYRVYALEKAFQSGHLNADQRHRVAEEMIQRCDSLVCGYRQKNNSERANFYERKKKKFEIEVSKLDLSSAAARSRPQRAPAFIRDEEESLSPTARL